MKPCIIFQFCKMLALEGVLPAIKPSAHFPVKQNQRDCCLPSVGLLFANA